MAGRVVAREFHGGGDERLVVAEGHPAATVVAQVFARGADRLFELVKGTVVSKTLV